MPASAPEAEKLPVGLTALRWFYERLLPTSSQMQAYLPDERAGAGSAAGWTGEETDVSAGEPAGKARADAGELRGAGIPGESANE